MNEELLKFYENCNSMPILKIAELCMDPQNDITLEGLGQIGFAKMRQLIECINDLKIESDWKEAISEDNRTSYRNFIMEWAHCPSATVRDHIDQARRRIDEILG